MQSKILRASRVKGKIERVWNKQTQKGKRYSVLQIDGERYSLWNENYFGMIQTGQTIEFDYQESGRYKNISKIYGPSGTKRYPIRFKNILC